MHYGGANALATGWVSHTLFEPHVGNKIFNEMLEEYPNIQRFHGYVIEDAIIKGKQVIGAAFIYKNGQTLSVQAAISIDATEYGELMAKSSANYFLGLDPKSLTNEDIAPMYGNTIIQDLTYAAILKDYRPGADKTIPRPPNYQPSIFRNACKELSENPDEFEGVVCKTMLNYARLPNEKFLLNWPNHGNDYYLNVIEMNHSEREILLRQAKNRTRQFIYFLQTEGGFKNLGLADDEFDTEDGFPYIPYHRESRRLDGLAMLTMNELLDPYEAGTDLYKTAIGVGDYPIDHHRKLNPSLPDSLLKEGDREPFEFETHFDVFPPIPSFSVPLGSLIPEEIDGLIVAEKSISVNSIANGASRLQPVVMTIQQSIGAGLDLFLNPNSARKHVGNRFEELLRTTINLLGIASKKITFKIPYETEKGQKLYRCETDLIISPYSKVKSTTQKLVENEIVLSFKITSKDRMGKIFLDKILMERFSGHPVKVAGIFLNDVQRKGKDNISYTLVSGLFMVYTKFLTELEGVYFLDQPPITYKQPYNEHIFSFSKLITSDIWKMLN